MPPTSNELEVKNSTAIQIENAEPFNHSIDEGMMERENNHEHKVHSDDVFCLAANYLDDAIHSRHIHFDTSRMKLIERYVVYKNPFLVWFTYLIYMLNCLLVFIEPPADVTQSTWTWLGSIQLSHVLEVFFIFYLLFRFIHEMSFTRIEIFWRDTKHQLMIVTLSLILLDMSVYLILDAFQYSRPIRCSRPLRAILIVNLPIEGRQVRQCFRNIRRTLPQIVNVFFLFIASVSLFALMAYKLFGTIDPDMFGSFSTSFWNLFVYVTTANSPDIMVKTYASNRVTSIYFIVFMFINLYIFMSIFLAVIYNQFKTNLKREIRDTMQRNRNQLEMIFDIISCRSNNSSVMCRESFFRLMSTLFDSGFMDRSRCDGRNKMNKGHYIDLLWRILTSLDENQHLRIEREDDSRKSRKISKMKSIQFQSLIQLLNISYFDMYENVVDWQSICPNFYDSKISQIIVRCVSHRIFRFTFDFFILLNAIFIALDLDGAEGLFVAIFSIEIALKMFAFGFRSFFSRYWNIFDFVLIGSAIIVSCISASASSTSAVDREIIDLLMIMRVTRIFKIFHTFTRFRAVLNTIVNILPSLLTYCFLLFITFYIYAIIGLELFSNLVTLNSHGTKCSSEMSSKLNGTQFVYQNYCPTSNFNGVFSTMVILFQLMLVNQWHVITEAYVILSHTHFTKVYFFTFNIVCVIILLNLFIAFILEAFILEFTCSSKRSMSSSLIESLDEMGLYLQNVKCDRQQLISMQCTTESSSGRGNAVDIARTTSIRFFRSSKSRSVQEMLEKMFESNSSSDSESGND